MKTPKGFIGVELGIALAILAVLAIAGAGSYVAYHDRMTASDTATTTPSATIAPAPTTTGSGSTSDDAGTMGSTRTVTAADSDTTIHLKVGDTFVLKLGDDKNWSNVAVDNTNVIGTVATFAAIPGAQGMYVAKAAGTATITAVGTAICNPGEMCPQYALLYKVTFVVD